MPSLQELAKKEGSFASGHRMCAGCPVPIITKMLSRVTEYPVVVCSATGCLEVASSVFPYSSWKVPWIHTAFENAAATLSGVEAMYQLKKRKGELKAETIKFIAIGGDGGTYDIGLQSLSGAMERGHDMLYICYDNGAYMNTGIQRSGATPFAAATTTSPSGTVIPGKQQKRKDLTSILVSHNIGYIGQASIHNPMDLAKKLKKGIEHDGPAFLNVFSPCIPGWKIGADMAVEAARVGVESCFWPLYEVVEGEYKLTYEPKEKLPINDWIFMQGMFRHLKKPELAVLVKEMQDDVDKTWERIKKLCSK